MRNNVISSDHLAVSSINGEQHLTGNFGGNDTDGGNTTTTTTAILSVSHLIELHAQDQDGPMINDFFGSTVSIDRDVLAVTAFNGNYGDGAVYIFERQTSGWTEVAKLTARSTEALLLRSTRRKQNNTLGRGKLALLQTRGAGFGFSQCVNGDTVLVGEYYYGGPSYVFRRDSGGNWRLEATLKPPDTDSSSLLGWSVTLGSDTAVIGAPGQSVNGSRPGAAYVYVRVGTTWSLQATLQAADATSGARFGSAVSVDADRIIVGASSTAVEGVPAAGAAYVFQRINNSWNQVAKLTDTVLKTGAAFGAAVSVRGDTFVATTIKMTASVFKWNSFLAPFKIRVVDELGKFDLFGTSVDQSDDIIVIGGEAAYLYLRRGNSWVEGGRVERPAGKVGLASSVSISGSTLAMSLINGGHGGAAYVGDIGSNGGAASTITTTTSTTTTTATTTTGTTTTTTTTLCETAACVGQLTELHAHDQDARVVVCDGFSSYVSVDRDVVAASGGGAVYLFERERTGWTEVAKLTGPSSAGAYGTSHSVKGDTLVVGSSHIREKHHSVYFYRRESNGGWLLEATVDSPDPSTSSFFGLSVGLDGDTAVIGAYGVSKSYVYVRHGRTWSLQATLGGALNGESRGLGYAVSIHDDRIIVGAKAATVNGVAGAGAALVFERRNNAWTQVAKLVATKVVKLGEFGTGVSVHGDTFAVTCRRPLKSMVTIFSWNEFESPFEIKFNGELNAWDAWTSVALSDDVLVIGRMYTAAYVYTRSGVEWVEAFSLQAPNNEHFFPYTLGITGSTLGIGSGPGCGGAVYVGEVHLQGGATTHPPISSTTTSTIATFTTTTTTTCRTASCEIYNDPHISGFDDDLDEGPASLSALVHPSYIGIGETWLVRSAKISVQGRLGPSNVFKQGGAVVKAIAIGGQLLNGNVLVVEPQTGNITWNGQRLPYGSFEMKLPEGQVLVTVGEEELKEGMPFTRTEIHLPMRTDLKINRYQEYLNTKITLPVPEGGIEGECASSEERVDDALGAQVGKRTGDSGVAPADSMFSNHREPFEI